jgi:hypothetical protein
LLPLTLIAGGALLLAVVAWLAWPRPAAPQAPIEVNGAPKLKVDRDRVDLGDVPLGQTVSASFTLTNVGDQPLRFGAAPYVETLEGC